MFVIISCPSHLWKSIHEGIHEPLKLTGGLSCKYSQRFQREKRQTDSHRHGKEKWHILLMITCLNDEERKKRAKEKNNGKGKTQRSHVVGNKPCPNFRFGRVF